MNTLDALTVHLRVALAVFAKERAEVLRDARALVLLIVVPAVLYPLLLAGSGALVKSAVKNVDQSPLTVAVGPAVPGDVRDAVLQAPGVRVASLGLPLRSTTAPHGVDAEVRHVPPRPGKPGGVVLAANQTADKGMSAVRRLQPVLEQALQNRQARVLSAYGVPRGEKRAGTVTLEDRSPSKKGAMGGALARMVPPLLIMMVVVGAFYPAIEATAGERERGAISTLLSAPVSPMAVALGKLGAVSMVALLAAASNVLSLVVTAKLGLGMAGATPDLPLGAVVVLVIVVVPLAVAVSAVLMACAALLSSVREANAVLMPVLLVLSLPGMAPSFPGTTLTPLTALIPVFGPAAVVRDAILRQLDLVHVGLAVLSSVVLLALAVLVAARGFSVEALMTGRIDRPRRLPGALLPFDSVLVLLGSVAGMVMGAIAGGTWGAGLLGGDPGTAAVLGSLFGTQAGLVSVPIVVALARSKRPHVALGLTVPQMWGWVSAAGALLLLYPIGMLAQVWLVDAAQNSPELMRLSEQLSNALSTWSPVAVIATLAVLPAVCEELVFRGAVLTPWLGKSRARTVWAIVLTSAVFALAHGSMIRWPVTFTVGLLVATVRVHGRSVLPAMLVHATHNGLAVFLASQAAEGLPEGATAADVTLYPGPWWAGALSAVAGAALLGVAARRAGHAGPPGVD